MAEETVVATVAVTGKPLDVPTIEGRVADPSAGAVVTFVGTVRNNHLDRAVLFLEYDAQEPLASKTMMKLAEEARAKFGLTRVALRHRIGRVEVGEPSVVVAVSAAHRGAAFDGCRHLIDALKTSVPIWKKEHYADGSAPQWVGPDGKPVGL